MKKRVLIWILCAVIVAAMLPVTVSYAAEDLDITSSELPPAVVGWNYNFTLEHSGGVAPYTWSITSISPSWFTIDPATGQLSGVPDAVGTFSLEIVLTDSNSPQASVSKILDLIINPALAVATESIPDGATGIPYSTSVSASGGAPPYRWSCSNLPDGLSIDPVTGVISGTPTVYFFSMIAVRVTDNNFHTFLDSYYLDKWLNLKIYEDSIIAVPAAGVLKSDVLNDSMVNLTILSTNFTKTTLSPADFTLINAPAGLTLAEASYTDSSHCTVRLAYSGVPIITNITDFRIGIKAEAVSCAIDLSSNIVVITAPMAASVQSVAAGNTPTKVDVNPVTGTAYVTNQMSRSITAIAVDGTTTTISTNQRRPLGVAVNPVTNRIYAANKVENTVTVIDGSNNSVIQNIVLGTGDPTNDIRDIKVNPDTNKIYVTHYTKKQLVVINGEDNTFTTTSLQGGPSALAINRTTNRIYVCIPDVADHVMVVIDGADNSVITTFNVGYYPDSLAVNEATNRIYVANSTEDKVRVINGETNEILHEIPVGHFPVDVAVNQDKNLIYVANSQSKTVSVINGIDNTVFSVPVAGNPMDLAVNTAANCVYVPGSDTATVTEIVGAGVSSTTIGVGASPGNLAVNPVNGKVYVTDGNGCSIITPNGKPAVITDTVDTANVDKFRAIVSGSVIADGGLPVTDRGFVYSLDADPAIGGVGVTRVQAGTGTGDFNTLLTGLTQSTTYHVRAYAINGAGTAYGEGKTFTTTNAVHYIVFTEGNGSIQRATGETNPNGAVIWNGKEWIVNSTWAHQYLTDGLTGARVKEADVISISQSTTDGNYEITARSYGYAYPAKDCGSYAFTGIEYDILDTVTGKQIVLRSRGTGSGTANTYFDIYITDDVTSGIPQTITAIRSDPKWFTYSGMTLEQALTQTSHTQGLTGEFPTTDGWYFMDVNNCADMGGKSYIFHTSSFPAGHTDDLGSSYAIDFALRYTDSDGNLHEMRFTPSLSSETYTPPASVPAVVTNSVDTANVDITTATVSGNVTRDGGLSVTERGFVYGPNAEPLIGGEGVTQVQAGIGIGNFSSTITGLTASTTYHVRAYAINEEGTSYGEDRIFVTKEIVKADTTISITADNPDPSAPGQPVTVTYSVSVTAPGSGTPTGNVTVSDGVDSATGTAEAGSVTLILTTPGTRSLTAAYSGDINFFGSTSAVELHTVQILSAELKITTSSPLPDGKVFTQYSQTFSAEGGESPYKWTIASGHLPPGICLNPCTGKIYGKPLFPGTYNFIVKVTDSATPGAAAVKEFTLKINTLLIITPKTLREGEVSVPYYQQLGVLGSDYRRLNWTIVSGALPDGLTLSGNIIGGVPRTDGAFKFTIQASDGTITASQSYSLKIFSKLAITTSSLPKGLKNQGYNQSVSATGGSGLIKWTIVNGTLPPGLKLNPFSGAVTGKPARTGAFQFTVMVTDNLGGKATQAFFIQIK